jgi:hypothetical protein
MQHPVHLLQLQWVSDSGKVLAPFRVPGTSAVISFTTFNLCAKMLANVTQVIIEYEERVRRMQVVPMFPHERSMLRSDGAPNRAFFYRQFSDHAMAIEFLKYIGLIRRTMQCYSCGRDMTCSERPDMQEGFHWRCQRTVAGARCNMWSDPRIASTNMAASASHPRQRYFRDELV